MICLVENEWFNKNYMRLKKICENIAKDKYCDDYFHFILEQTLKNKKFKEIENNEERIYFFSRIAKLNWISVKSPWRQHQKNFNFDELPKYFGEKETDEIEFDEIELVEDIDMNWVNNELKIMKRGKDWYYARLFELYIDAGASLTETSIRTTIPINSVSRDIKKVREILKKKRREHLGL